MSVYFHGSFRLNRPRFSELLKVGLSNPKVSDKELAKPFGYGQPFAQKYRSWLHKTGFTESRLPMRLTEKGKVVYENDPGLKTLVSQWFMHWELTQDEVRAEAWHFFINEFLPKHETFDRSQLIEGLMMKLGAHSMKHFGPESKLNPIIARKLIECYTEGDALGDLGFLEIEKNQFVRTQPTKVLGPWKTPEELNKSFKH